jgi:hypothetical protein
MLSKEQAAQIAEGLVSQARAAEGERRDAKARRPAFVYRSSQLLALRPWRQMEVVWEAKRKVAASWSSNLLVFGSAGAVFALLWWFVRGLPSGVVVAAAAISSSIGAFFRAILVRSAAARLARLPPQRVEQ